MGRTLILTVMASAVWFGPGKAFSQAQPAVPAFEIISIKPTPKERLYQLKRECSDVRFVSSGTPLSFLIEWSYRLGGSRLVGLPPWTAEWDLAYDIEAKAAAPMNQDQCRLMVQALLAERFKMAAHRETRELRAYELVVGRNGPKVHEVTGVGDGPGVRLNGARFQSLSDAEPPRGLTMSRLSSVLGDYAGLPVVDRTGLKGVYGFELAFSIKEGDDRPSIFTAVQEQLGLKLQITKALLEVLVVDHIEKASAN